MQQKFKLTILKCLIVLLKVLIILIGVLIWLEMFTKIEVVC